MGNQLVVRPQWLIDLIQSSPEREEYWKKQIEYEIDIRRGCDPKYALPIDNQISLEKPAEPKPIQSPPAPPPKVEPTIVPRTKKRFTLFQSASNNPLVLKTANIIAVYSEKQEFGDSRCHKVEIIDADGKEKWFKISYKSYIDFCNSIK